MTVKSIQPGDTIGILCPASPIGDGDAEACKKALEALGYKVKVGQSAISLYGGYLAGDDALRARDINEMFKDDTIDGIFCIRGGYGTSRVIDLLDIEVIRNNPKMFVGYSDITNLHVVLNQAGNMPTLHGPMVYSNILNDFDHYTKESFLNLLSLPKNATFENPVDEPIECLVAGQAIGQIIGGNLAILAAGIGTPYELDSKDKLLFIEEIGETTYRVDRMLQQLIDAGKIEDCAGIIFGDFDDCEPRDASEFTIKEIIEEKIKPFGKPMISNVKSGHCKPMGTIPFGTMSLIDATKGKLVFNIDSL